MPDLFDLLALAGLVMLGVGLWWIWPPLALAIPGALLLAIGLVAAWLRGGRPSSGPEG